MGQFLSYETRIAKKCQTLQTKTEGRSSEKSEMAFCFPTPTLFLMMGGDDFSLQDWRRKFVHGTTETLKMHVIKRCKADSVVV